MLGGISTVLLNIQPASKQMVCVPNVYSVNSSAFESLDLKCHVKNVAHRSHWLDDSISYDPASLLTLASRYLPQSVQEMLLLKFHFECAKQCQALT